ncbi:hypothetical protein [Amycolatopsis sp. NPDC098790]|uniref:hypothetical protein n=1 Tax=Amycolatopsis sp. NPDC098790 TaxID=3363939 RepID=UPI0037FFE1C9
MPAYGGIFLKGGENKTARLVGFLVECPAASRARVPARMIGAVALSQVEAHPGIMGGRDFVDRVVAAGERKAARDQDRNRRRAAIERAIRVPALIGAGILALVAWWLSGWEMWPWLFGGIGGLLAVLVFARRLPPVWRLTGPLLVVGVWLLTYVDPWWWVLLAGVAVTGAGVASLVMLQLRVRRWQTLTALALGVAMVATGWVMLAVDAARHARQSQQELDQAHDEAVARILPHSPGSMVNFLAERIARPTPDAVADACFVFAPAARQQLADARHVPDCPAAIRAMAAEVTAAGDYVNNLSLPGQATQPNPDGTLFVDACHLDFSGLTDDTPHANPGPQIGRLTLAQQRGQGHLVVAYQPCAGV